MLKVLFNMTTFYNFYTTSLITFKVFIFPINNNTAGENRTLTKFSFKTEKIYFLNRIYFLNKIYKKKFSEKISNSS